VSKEHYFPAGGGEATSDNNKQRITRPAKILAIAIGYSLFSTPDSAILRPNVSAPV
jgi:hypothetical protein